jgi:hypothetical protein
MGNRMSASVYVAIGMLAAILAVAIFDLIAGSRANGLETVSEVIWRWSSDYPILPFAIGLVIGHLFWSRRG